LPKQQNLAARRIAVLILPTTSWPRLQAMASRIAEELNSLQPGHYREVPFER
jgi:hypothetical protein